MEMDTSIWCSAGISHPAAGPHDSFAYIYWNGPDGLREDRRTLLPAEGINSMSIADFNNDGHLDLFIGSYHDGRKRHNIDSYIYWNSGGRGFSRIQRDCSTTPHPAILLPISMKTAAD